jgi:hypothetical protein
MVTSLHVNLLVAIGLFVYGGGMPPQPPKRVNSHLQLGGRSPRDSPNGRLLRGK